MPSCHMIGMGLLFLIIALCLLKFEEEHFNGIFVELLLVFNALMTCF